MLSGSFGKSMQTRRGKPGSWGEVKINPISWGEISSTWWGTYQDALAYWYNEKFVGEHDEIKGEHSETKRSTQGKTKTKLSTYC